MKKIRVLHISLTCEIGGIESYQKNLLMHIDREKFDFEYVTTYKNAALLPFFEENGCKVHYLPAQKTVIPYCIALYKVIKRGNFDAVHIHKNSCANPMAFLTAKCAGVKTVIAHSHNTAPVNSRVFDAAHYIFRPLVKKFSDVFLACSDKAADWLFGKGNRATVVKNGIDLENFVFNSGVRDEVRKELSLGDNIVFGHVGNFIPQKNHRFMVDIVGEAVKLCPSVKMLFVGGGERMEEIKKYVRDKGLSGHVIFLGTRKDTCRIYQAMDVFCFPSLHEGLPIAGVEAQASGLPCFFSDAVTDEIVLCDTARKMKLGDGAKAWAAAMLEAAAKRTGKDTSDALKKAGYDAAASARTVAEIYLSSCKKAKQ